MSLTIKQLLDKQPPYIKNSAKSIKVLSLKRILKNKLPALQAVVQSRVDNNTYTCQVVTMNEEGSIKVSCNCDFFKYYCEYALSKWEAANIRFSNGKPAKVTNPSNYPLVCSHIFHILKKM